MGFVGRDFGQPRRDESVPGIRDGMTRVIVGETLDNWLYGLTVNETIESESVSVPLCSVMCFRSLSET